MKWRRVISDAETASAVSPVCGRPTEHAEWAKWASVAAAADHPVSVDSPYVYDCCSGPYIDCYTEDDAKQVEAALNAACNGDGAYSS